MFQTILSKTLAHEGGYANVKGDRGGETYKGIARKFHPNWKGWEIVDQNKPLNWNEFIDCDMLEKHIEDFYFENFWKRIQLDKVEDLQLAAMIFDIYMNSGSSGAKLVQRACNLFGQNLAVDGAIGSKTISAINAIDGCDLFEDLKELRINYYYRIAENGENKKFLKGWLKRAKSFNYEYKL
ncbi:glycoside hydrolase family 108 protein [Aureibacter tunicatorum]|uniref:Lysozyme family protein n=1 Tax=Aureibacter tunicatorum TaxID=866807 RepID=A0AAE3XQA9_9BACT|nr:glycosyl hydrolase 108 family protein [Aureibacter tunicatorum]MDR6239971.1 lysozyme family protein [Aureibacter tunicatorum]BDD04443.1 hypothetical protein AUTU_19260 [Aureibacter tunicatorum]